MKANGNIVCVLVTNKLGFCLVQGYNDDHSFKFTNNETNLLTITLWPEPYVRICV